MTQTAERAIPYDVYERELERRKQAERTTESQMRTINALQNEVHWLEAAIFNPAFNEVDIRLVAKNTPREIRMGLTDEAPERKIYLPACGDEVYTSDKTAGRHLRKLKDMGAFSYRTERDPETGNTRAILGALPAVSMPAALVGESASRGGGSTWEDGKRIKRCQTCYSPLEHRTQVRCTNPDCPDCGKILDGEWKSANHLDIDPDSQSDTDPQTHECPPPTVDTVGVVDRGDVQDTPDSHSDCRPPEVLKSRPIWCVHRAKVPYNARAARDPQKAKSNDPTSWTSYDQAQATYQESQGWKHPYDGVGLMCDGTFTVIDYDHCIEYGQIDELADCQIQGIDSYAEISYSGTGVHQIALATLPRNIKQPGIEMYDHCRFITWTGKHLAGTPFAIEPRQEQTRALFAEIAPPEVPVVMPESCRPENYANNKTDDEEVLRKARNGRNGSGAKFRALYDDGDWSGYPSQSEADIALCALLAYWSDYNVFTIDRLFRKSGLMRPKWDEKRSSETYGHKTLNNAISGIKNSRKQAQVQDDAA